MTEPTTPTELENCIGCGVAPEQPHEDMCDHAYCAGCGEQRIQGCDCEDDEAERPAIWHGVDPYTEVATARGWWRNDTYPDGEPFTAPDLNRAVLAAHLDMITWNPQTQRYDIGEIDEAKLDQLASR